MKPSINTDKLLQNQTQGPNLSKPLQKIRILYEKEVIFNLKQKYATFDIFPWDEGCLQEEVMEFLIKLPDGQFFLVLITGDVDGSALNDLMPLAQSFLETAPHGGIILMYDLNGEISATVPPSWCLLQFSPD